MRVDLRAHQCKSVAQSAASENRDSPEGFLRSPEPFDSVNWYKKRDPENPLPLIELVSLELNTNNKYDTLKPHLEKLMTLNAPPSDLLRRAYTLLGSDRYIYNPDHQALLKQIESTLEKERRREQEAQQQPESDVAA